MRHKVLQASVVRQNNEGVAQKVGTPFANHSRDSIKLSNIRGCTLETGAKNLTKIHDGMGLLKKYSPHGRS